MLSKYHDDGPFMDPIVICDSCQEIQLTENIKEFGKCCKCGNKKFRNVLVIPEEQQEKILAMNLDPDFLALFEEVNHG